MTTVTADAAYELVRSELLDCGVEPELVHGDATFEQLDIDSLDAAELLTFVKKEFGVEIRRRDLTDLNIDGLVGRIVAGASAS